jgi:hypothetical protein
MNLDQLLADKGDSDDAAVNKRLMESNGMLTGCRGARPRAVRRSEGHRNSGEDFQIQERRRDQAAQGAVHHADPRSFARLRPVR